ncbi:MAG: flavin-binding protein, partial [Phycisphaerales bacterium]
FYDAGRKLQLRVAAVAEVHATGARADEAWARSAPSSRRCYLAPAAPGARCDAVSPNLPEALRLRVPTVEESLAGRVNFALVATRVTAIDWLHLASEGHERARFQRGDDGLWSGCWCEP